MGFNYAHAFGFHSVAAAIIFAILYVPLLGWFVIQSLRRPTYVHFVLTFFCALRVAAFSIRAALAGLESAGEDLNLLIVDEVLSGVGYFGLLYSAYTLVLDIELLSDRPPPVNPILLLIRNRRLFRLVLLGAVVMGVIASTSNNGTTTTAKALHKVSVILFLILTILQAFQTIMLAKDMSATGSSQYIRDSATFGRRHGVHILILISLLLIIREAFSTATIGNTAKLNNEHLWYPFIAIPEILAVILYTTPDLVPAREELQTQTNNKYALDARYPQQA